MGEIGKPCYPCTQGISPSNRSCVSGFSFVTFCFCLWNDIYEWIAIPIGGLISLFVCVLLLHYCCWRIHWGFPSWIFFVVAVLWQYLLQLISIRHKRRRHRLELLHFFLCVGLQRRRFDLVTLCVWDSPLQFVRIRSIVETFWTQLLLDFLFFLFYHPHNNS